jgi:AcrR family transcriptional regulator
MPKVTPQHQEARKTQIIEAAVACFVRKGFHRTSMQDIVAESGLSPGAIYLYFKSKEEIIQTIADLRHAREAEMIAAAFRNRDTGRSLSRLVETFFYALLDPAVKKERILGVQLWGEALSNPAVAELARRGIDAPLAVLTGVLTKYREEKPLPGGLTAQAMARVILAQFQGFVVQFLLDDGLAIEEYSKAVQALLSHWFPEA